jgi:hypothetical protein
MSDSPPRTHPPQMSSASPKLFLSLSVELLHSFLRSSKLEFLKSRQRRFSCTLLGFDSAPSGHIYFFIFPNAILT